MFLSTDKDKKPKPNEEVSSEQVIPIYNGKTQESTSLEQAITDLGNNRPTTWSIIR